LSFNEPEHSTPAEDFAQGEAPRKQRRTCKRKHLYWSTDNSCPTCYVERRAERIRKEFPHVIGDGSPRRCVECGKHRPPEHFHIHSNGVGGVRMSNTCYPCHRKARQAIADSFKHRRKEHGSEHVIDAQVKPLLEEMTTLNRQILAARREGVTWRPDVQRKLSRVAELRLALNIDTPTVHGVTRGLVLAGWTGPANGLGAALQHHQ
jgi:hypothetical protein